MYVCTHKVSLTDAPWKDFFWMSSKNILSQCLVFHQILSLETKAFLILEDTFLALYNLKFLHSVKTDFFPLPEHFFPQGIMALKTT